MYSISHKVLIIVSLFCLIIPIFTSNAAADYYKINFSFRSEDFNGYLNRPGLMCPDSRETEIFGSVRVVEGILELVNGPQGAWHDRYFALSDLNNHYNFIDITNFRVSGVPPNQQFVVEGVENQDTICNSSVPTRVAIQGSCSPYSIATFYSSNGQRGQFKIEPLIGGSKHADDKELPICFVCPAFHHALFDDLGTGELSCVEEDLSTMNASQRPDYADSGANPSAEDSIIGQVKRDERPSTNSSGIADGGMSSSQESK